MKFVALLPVRDEADIIGQCLQHALQWVDAIYVFDTGSVDETWEIVHDFAGRDSRVIPIRKEPVFFSESLLRGYMFHIGRQTMREGDWFLRFDADEFHQITPPAFVKDHMRRHETIAYHQYYNFRLLQSEVDEWVRGAESMADRARRIEERRRHYIVSVYSEPRLCRYRTTMRWPEDCLVSLQRRICGPRAVATSAIIRIATRSNSNAVAVYALIMMADHENRANWTRPELHHWAQCEWRKFITPDNLPDLKKWMRGTELPLVHQSNHLRPWPIRTLQRFVHAFCLPILDRKRAGWSDTARPQPIPPRLARSLALELRGMK